MTTVRIYTIYNYLDIAVQGELTTETLSAQLEEGNTIALQKTDGNLFLLNNLNVLAIEVVRPENISQKEMPPITK